MKCSKCEGTGQYLHYGTCFRCGGTGGHSPKATSGPKYQVGAVIRKNRTGHSFTIKAITRRDYVCTDLTKLGRHIDKYPEDSKEGYTLVTCSHKENETIEIPGTLETVTICHKCGEEI